ncbi:DUF7521 family protein [Candidatus Halobonum tyrrellensis]|uniref:YapH protein n=1 Tax=Candidatus Halobonum tyrrellensis G22 TaxID=1324957 RepID=V4HHC9_9EURY|nr:hypothetical protein [Candidatus Halobonum tyrrellensis]ESP90170.1 hypothetical protein K933_01377 [Candidatus Halobonum tyrrellensis G22]
MWVDTAIIAVKTVTLLLGSGITYIAYKAHRGTGAPSLRMLAVGFGTVTLGALLAGIAHQLLSVPLEVGVLINSVLVAVGFAVIMYSLYLERG